VQTELIILDIILGVQTIAICSAIVFLVWSLERMKKNDVVNTHLKSVLPKIDEILATVNALTKAALPAGEEVGDISKDVRKIVESTREAAQRVSDTAQTVSDTVRDLSLTVRRQISRADGIMSENLEKVESISDQITEKIVGPLSEISAILKGGAVAVKYLRGARAATVAQGDGHEEDGADAVANR
jgi:methyl-accepting chemotaxis protein